MNIVDIRVPTLDTNLNDVHVFGVAYEESSPTKEIINAKVFPVYSIHYILSGRGFLVFNKQIFEVGEDTIFVTFPNQDLLHYPHPEDPWSFGYMTVDGLKVSEYLNRAGFTFKKPFIKIKRDDEFREIFHRAPYIARKNPNIVDFVALSTFYRFLVKMIELYPGNILPASNSAVEEHVAKAVAYVNLNFSNPKLNLTEVAKHLGLCNKYLSMIFKRISGNTFSNYLYNKRLSTALSLMRQGNSHVGDIAHKCGFSSPYYFSRQFKKYNRVAPKHHIMNLGRNKKDEE